MKRECVYYPGQQSEWFDWLSGGWQVRRAEERWGSCTSGQVEKKRDEGGCTSGWSGLGFGRSIGWGSHGRVNVNLGWKRKQ